MKNIYINLIIISIIIIFIIYNIYLYYNKEKFTSGTLCEIDKLADEFCTGNKLVDIGTNWVEIPIDKQYYSDEVEITNQNMKDQFLQMINQGIDPPINLTKIGYENFITNNNVIVTEKSFIKIIKPGQSSFSKYIPQSAYGYHWLKVGLDKKIYEDEEEITNTTFKTKFKTMVFTYKVDPPKNITLQVYNWLVNDSRVYVGKKSYVIIDKDDGTRHKYIPNDQGDGVCWWVPLDNKKVCREICPEAAKQQIISQPIKIETNYKNTSMLLTERERLLDNSSEIAEGITEIIENTNEAQQNLLDNTISQRALEEEINNSVTPLIWTVKLEITEDDIELDLIGLKEKITEKLQEISTTLTTGDYIILTDLEWQNILWNNYAIVEPQKNWKKFGNILPNDDPLNEITISSIPVSIYQKFIINGQDPLSVKLSDTDKLTFPIINKNNYLKNQNDIYYIPFITYNPTYNSYVKIGNKYFTPSLWGNCSPSQKDVLIDNIKLGLENQGYIDRSTLPSGSLVYKNKDINNVCTINNYGRQGNLPNEYITFTKLNTDLNIEQSPNIVDISDQLKSFRNSKVSANNDNNLVTMDANYSQNMKDSITNTLNRNYYSKYEYNSIISNWDTEKTEILLDEDSKIGSTQNTNCGYTKDQVNTWNTRNFIRPSDDISNFENIGTWGKIGIKNNIQHQNLYTLNENILIENTQKTQRESECFINTSTINSWETTPNYLNWKNIGRFPPNNKTEYNDPNISHLIAKLRLSTKIIQSDYDSIGLINPINPNHYVIVDNNYYIPIVDPVILTNINDGEGDTKWVYNDSANSDYMLLNDYKTAKDNLNNFKCAYTNQYANSFNDSTITPSLIPELHDVVGTWGKIAKSSDKTTATTNYLCPNDEYICDKPNLVHVIKSDLNTLDQSLEQRIQEINTNCGMTTSEVSSLNDTFTKNGNTWGRITPVSHLDSGGLAPYDTNININSQKASYNCYYSLQEVDSQWGNRVTFDNINYGKVGTSSDEFMLIDNVDSKISSECPVTNDNWNQGLFIKESPYGESIFKDFENINYGVVKDSDGNLTSDYITNSLCNTQSAADVATLQLSQSSTTDTDSYTQSLNGQLKQIIGGLKTQSEDLKSEISAISSQHDVCLNNLKDGNSFKMSYDDYVKSKENLEKLNFYKTTGTTHGTENAELWRNKYSKKLYNGNYVEAESPAEAIQCKIQSIVVDPIVWHNVNPITDGNNITNTPIGTWFVDKINIDKYKTSFLSSEIPSNLDLNNINIGDYIIVDNKYYKPKLLWNNPVEAQNRCIDINKTCRSNDNTIPVENYDQTLQQRKDLINIDRGNLCGGPVIRDIELKGFNHYMKTNANKYKDIDQQCKRQDSVNTSFTNENTCSSASDGTLKECRSEASTEDCCTKENENYQCLPNTNITVQELNNIIQPMEYNANGQFNSVSSGVPSAFKQYTESQLQSSGFGSYYASAFVEGRDRYGGGKCKITSDSTVCPTIANIPKGLVWKKILKDDTIHTVSNKIPLYQIPSIISNSNFGNDILIFSIQEFNDFQQNEKNYIQLITDENKWLEIANDLSKVYVLDANYNDIANCKPQNYVDPNLYITPKPGDPNNFCSGTDRSCISLPSHNTKLECLENNYDTEIGTCGDITQRCDFNHLVINNCKTNSKSATGLSWYIIKDRQFAMTDIVYKLNKNNKFALLTNKLKQIYLNDTTQEFINFRYTGDTGSESAIYETYLNNTQYTNFILNELTEPLTSDHYIAIEGDIYFKAIPSWSHTEVFDGSLSEDLYEYPNKESCDISGISFQSCEECPIGYYREDIDKTTNYLIGHPEYGSQSDYAFSEEGYNILIWKNTSQNKINAAIAAESFSSILDIIEDSNYNYDEVEDPGITKGLMVLTKRPQNQNRTKINDFSSGNGKYKIMYIDGYININKTGTYTFDIHDTKIGYKIWINSIPYIEKFPTRLDDSANIIQDEIDLYENNFYHFEIIIFNSNYILPSNYLDVNLVNTSDDSSQKLKLYKEGTNPWCGTCVKCGGCPTEGQIREGCGIDGGATEYSQGSCSNCGSCDASGNLNSA